MKTVAKIIDIFGGVQNLYASIENPPYLRLVLEDIAKAREAIRRSASLTTLSRMATCARTPKCASS